MDYSEPGIALRNEKNTMDYSEPGIAFRNEKNPWIPQSRGSHSETNAATGVRADKKAFLRSESASRPGECKPFRITFPQQQRDHPQIFKSPVIYGAGTIEGNVMPNY